jgi:hypothetical protein
MCCMVLDKRYIFAVQITLQRKVEVKKKNYTSCNEFQNQSSYRQKQNSKTRNKLKQ